MENSALDLRDREEGEGFVFSPEEEEEEENHPQLWHFIGETKKMINRHRRYLLLKQTILPPVC